jgi:uncharacterized protein (DUF58 family)
VRCGVHCPPRRGALCGPLRALAVLAVVSLAVSWLSGAWPLVLAVAAVLAAVAAAAGWALAGVSRRLARLAVVRWPSRERDAAAVHMDLGYRVSPATWERYRRAALPAPPKAITAPVVPGVVAGARDGGKVEA